MSTMSEINLKVNVSYGGSSLSDEANSDTLYLFVLWGVLLPLVAGAGLVGNVLTMLVLWRREMNSTTILYLRGLVITDTGILIGSVITLTPLACANYLKGEALGYFKDQVYPLIHNPGFYAVMTLQQINVWITVSVSVERYIAICHPFRAARLLTRKKTMLVLIGIAVFSLLYNAPHLFAYKAAPCQTGEDVGDTEESSTNATGMLNDTIMPDGPGFKYAVGPSAPSLKDKEESAVAILTTSIPELLHAELTRAPSTTQSSGAAPSSSCLQVVNTAFGMTFFYTFHRTIMYLIIIYVLPFLALLILNTFLIRELMTMQRRNVNASSQEENEANLSLVLILIVIVFIFCQTPGLVSQFDFIPVSMFMTWLGVSNLLFTTNSAVNFLIYTAFGRKFRRVLLRVFRHFSASKRRRASSASSCHVAAFTQCSVSNANDVELSPVPATKTNETGENTASHRAMDNPSSSTDTKEETLSSNGSITTKPKAHALDEKEAEMEESTPLTANTADMENVSFSPTSLSDKDVTQLNGSNSAMIRYDEVSSHRDKDQIRDDEIINLNENTPPVT